MTAAARAARQLKIKAGEITQLQHQIRGYQLNSARTKQKIERLEQK